MSAGRTGVGSVAGAGIVNRESDRNPQAGAERLTGSIWCCSSAAELAFQGCPSSEVSRGSQMRHSANAYRASLVSR